MTFRKDIQILRGIAVLLVVLFHLQVGIVKSGFLGVDIFFVISGFLMAILYDPNDKKKFFLRRSKRLLPTYYMIIILTVIGSIFITIPNEFYQVVKQSIYATFFSSNIGFWMESSYFSKSHFNPLLHLWSLGVEIQFYLIVPLLYWMFHKAKIVFPVILFLSLVGCFVIVGVSPKTSFFMMPLRLWEFLIGYGIAVYFTNNGDIKYSSFRWLGLIAIFVLFMVPTFGVDGEALGFIHGHPGLYALIVSLSTGLILAFGIPKYIEKSKVGTSLEILGKYSYSIYLVHFPVIVFFLYKPFSGTILKTDSIMQTMTMLSMIVVLSLLMYHLVENPARHSKKIIRNLLIAPLLILILIFAGYSFQQSIYSKQELAIFNASKDRATYRCGKLARILDPAAITCKITNELQNADRKILLLGNSHADSIKSTFASVANELNVEVYFIVQNNPLMRGGLEAKNIIADAVAKGVDSIVIHYSPDALNIATRQKIKDVIQLASNKGIDTSLIMPVPVWDQFIPKALFNHSAYDEALPEQTSSKYEDSNKEIYKDFLTMNNKDFQLYHVKEILCPNECQIVNSSGKPFYFDDEHLTLTGAELLKPLLYKIVSETTRTQDVSTEISNLEDLK